MIMHESAGFIYFLDRSYSCSITFELVSWLIALDGTELVSQLLTEMAVKMININLISVQQKL